MKMKGDKPSRGWDPPPPFLNRRGQNADQFFKDVSDMNILLFVRLHADVFARMS